MAIVVCHAECGAVMRILGSRRVWTLEEVTGAVAARFDDVRPFWVEAEIDALRPVGGQVYFELRGGHVVEASMNGALFQRVTPRPGAGSLVHAYGRIEYYRQRSRISMRVERLELAGEGLLKARIDELRRRLDAEGLLRTGRERPLPLLPRRVALVTSPAGAARDDFVRNAWARFADLDILIVGTPVQGDDAPRSIARAVRAAGTSPRVDVVVVARGGGSLEDLMAFNSETVCRAVAACPVPIVSAVGHERDRTVCDEVADLTVSTPTAAAMAVVPSREALEVRLTDRLEAMVRGLDRAGGDAQRRLERRTNGLVAGLERAARRADERLERAASRMGAATTRTMAAAGETLGERDARAERALAACAERAGARVDAAAALLRTLSPDATVARGYAIVRDADSGRVVVDGADLERGRRVALQMRDRRVTAQVEGE